MAHFTSRMLQKIEGLTLWTRQQERVLNVYS